MVSCLRHVVSCKYPGCIPQNSWLKPLKARQETRYSVLNPESTEHRISQHLAEKLGFWSRESRIYDAWSQERKCVAGGDEVVVVSHLEIILLMEDR